MRDEAAVFIKEKKKKDDDVSFLKLFQTGCFAKEGIAMRFFFSFSISVFYFLGRGRVEDLPE